MNSVKDLYKDVKLKRRDVNTNYKRFLRKKDYFLTS